MVGGGDCLSAVGFGEIACLEASVIPDNPRPPARLASSLEYTSIGSHRVFAAMLCGPATCLGTLLGIGT